MSSRNSWRVRHVDHDAYEQLLKDMYSMGLPFPKSLPDFLKKYISVHLEPFEQCVSLGSRYGDVIRNLNPYNGSKRVDFAVCDEAIEKVQEVGLGLKRVGAFFIDRPVDFFQAPLKLAYLEGKDAP